MTHPRADRPTDTSSELIAWAIFDSYAKRIIRNYGRNLRRGLFRRMKHEVVNDEPNNAIVSEDHYPSEDLWFKVGNRVYCIHHEAVYEGLLRLPDNKLEALVRHYWELQTDVEIGRYFGVTDRTIRKWRQKSIEEIRQYVNGGTEVVDRPDSKGSDFHPSSSHTGG